MEERTAQKIIDIIEDKIYDLEYENSKPRFSNEYYLKLDAKIEVLNEILRSLEY